ncbi:hypothetical protein SLA2020_322090 [Shorea laevis]
MTQDNQGNNPVPPADFSVKRTRGRPRKYPRLHLNHTENAHDLRIQNQNREDNARCPPGFDVVNSNQNNNGTPGNNANDMMVGQVVNGVIEAAFDAGYLLTVRVGNSKTTLRGVVFKPGHVVPVSAENDVAPNVPMIRRNVIPFPKERNGQHVKSTRNRSPRALTELQLANYIPRAAQGAVNFGVSKGKQVHSLTTHTASPTISRGTLVPVVLQPVKLPNGGSIINQPVQVVSQPPHLVTSRSKKLSEAAHATSGATTTGQMTTVGNQSFPAPPQNDHQLLSKGMQSEAGTCDQPQVEVSVEAEAESMRSPGMPFEKLLTEVMKRVQASSQPEEAHAGNLSGKDPVHSLEDNKPLSIKPLQAVQLDYSVPAFKPLESYKFGKMTELLQAVQENMRENQAAQATSAACVPRETALAEN